MDDTNEETRPPITEEEETSENQEETTTPKSGEAEKPEQSKDLQSALAQKEHFREKAEAAEKQLEALKKENPPKETPEGDTEKAEVWEMSNDPLEVVELGKLLSDYTKEETEFILRNAPTRNVEGIRKAIEDPMVTTAIQGIRDKAEKENKTPAPGSPNFSDVTYSAEEAVKEGNEMDEVRKRYEKVNREKGEGV